MSVCPCGSGRDFSQCCQLYIDGVQAAPTAEALMRSRYSAYTLVDLDYLEKTHDISTRGVFKKDETKTWAEEVQWLNLEIVETHKGRFGDQDGTVEFIASYLLGNKRHRLHEI